MEFSSGFFTGVTFTLLGFGLWQHSPTAIGIAIVTFMIAVAIREK